MKRFILGFVLAISIPAFAAAIIWPSGVYLETFQNGFKFGTGKILSVLNDVITFDGKRLDDADKDIFFQEDFEGAAVSFTCDANIAAADDTGLMGSATSKSFTQSTGAQDEICYSDNIAFAGAQEGKLCLVSSGSTNFDLKVYDVTNSSYLGTAPLRGESNQDCVWFEGESTTANIRYELVVRIEEDADKLIIDNIKAKYFPFEVGDINELKVLDEKILSGTSSSIGDISSLTLTGLEVGKTYNLSGHLQLQASSGASMVYIRSEASNGGELYGRARFGKNTSGDADATLAIDTTFKAVSDSVYFYQATTYNVIGDGTKSGSYVTLSALAPKKSVTVKNTTSSDIASENVFKANITNASGTITVSEENIEGWVNDGLTSEGATARVVVNYSGLGLTSAPLVDADPIVPTSGVISAVVESATATQAVIRTENSSDVDTRANFIITVTRSKTDWVKERDRVYTFAADSFKGNSVLNIGTSGQAVTANVTDIEFTEIRDNASAWSVDSYTVQDSNSIISISGATEWTANGRRFHNLFLNGVYYKYIGVSSGNNSQDSVHPFNFTSARGEFNKGDVITIRAQVGGSTVNNSSGHWLTINESYGDRGTFVGQWGYESCFVKEQEANNTAAGANSSGTNIRTLNSTSGDCNFLSLSSAQITLAKGSYDVSCRSPAFEVLQHQAYFYNATDATNSILGTSEYNVNGSSVTNSSFLEGRVVVTSSKDFELRHYMNTVKATNGLGIQANASVGGEVYAQCKITKVR